VYVAARILADQFNMVAKLVRPSVNDDDATIIAPQALT
jgi:hypothetical protein